MLSAQVHRENVPFEIQAHRANDAATLRRVLAARPTSIEVDVGLGPRGLVVAHETGRDDVSRLSVDDVLEVAGDTPVIFDVKCFPPATPGRADFLAALRLYLHRVSICSFDERLVASLERRRTPATLLFDRPLRSATCARTLGPRADLVTRELVDTAHRSGARVVPWTVNDAREMAALLELGIDGLVTDRPALARAVLAETGLDGQGHRSVA